MTKFSHMLPGLGVVGICALAAMFLSEHYRAPVMLLALLLGIAMAFLYEETRCHIGIDFIACHVLRFGVALIGLRIAIQDLIDLGWETIMLLAAAIASTLIIGILFARLFEMPKQFGVLSGGAVGICGASAALAISSALPNNEHKQRDTTLTVIGVTILSTLSMVLYPILAAILEMTDHQTSIFLGATIHDVAQVVGAGYSVSEQTGDMATLIKLVRISLLVPVVIIISVTFSQHHQQSTTAPILPIFLIAFILLMLLNSFINIPAPLLVGAAELSRFALVLAIAAIGMKSNLRQLLQVGVKPIAIMMIETIWIAILIIATLLFI